MPDSLSKKYYKISEVSEMLELPAPTLRFWESRFPELAPRRNDGGTRFYTPADIETLRIIRFLVRDRGLKIAAAREQLRTNREGLSRRSDALERLKRVRADLNGLLEALTSRRQGRFIPND